MIDQAVIDRHRAECDAMMSTVPDGPWKKEPHRVEFDHAGLRCLLVRQPRLLHWCGYVGVPTGHPAHGKRYDAVGVDVHGGLTFAEECGGFVCHVSDNEALYWLGFDCAHSRDLSPFMVAMRAKEDWPKFPALPNGFEDVYRDVEWVTAETKRLAQQLAGMKAA